jgi:hypothetical protein
MYLRESEKESALDSDGDEAGKGRPQVAPAEWIGVLSRSEERQAGFFFSHNAIVGQNERL